MIQETPEWVRQFGHEFIIVCFVLIALGLTLLCGILLLDYCKRKYANYRHQKTKRLTITVGQGIGKTSFYKSTQSGRTSSLHPAPDTKNSTSKS